MTAEPPETQVNPALTRTELALERTQLAWVRTAFVLVALVLFTILDFDRPRRGLIQIDHTSLIELRESMKSDGADPRPQPE